MGKKSSKCCICGESKKLSFEHIPPKSTGNSNPIKGYDIRYMLLNGRSNLKDTEGLSLHYKFNRGVGDYTLCKACNEYMGSHYVEQYACFIQGFIRMLNSFENPITSKTIITITENKGVKALAFFKQVIAMFCSLTGDMADCKYFLLDKDSNDFNINKYRLCMVVVPNKDSNGWRTTTGWGTRYLFHDDNSGNVSQRFAAYLQYPVGFLLYRVDDSAKSYVGCDITQLSQCKFDDTPNFGMNIPCIDVDTALPEFLN